MKKYTQTTRQLLEQAQRRFVRSRPGSVLILVVALLLLMAIIGTAYMSMAQADRSTSAQHTNNTEIDLLVEGVISIVKGTIISDLYSQSGQYRAAVPRYNTADSGSYRYVSSLGDTLATVVPGTPWIASHQPELQSEYQNPPTGAPMWRFITAPLTGGEFASPLPPIGPAFLFGQTILPPYTYNQRTIGAQPLVPGEMSGFPAWISAGGGKVLAADADGDGEADSGLVKLPMGAINGVTYYYAVRIIDNAAAINVNTAWQHNPYVAAAPVSPNLPGDFFPTNIDLVDLLVGPDGVTGAPSGINKLIKYRAGLPPANPFLFASNPRMNWQAYDDVNAASRSDITFYPLLEAQWNGLGRRLSNPGEFTINTPYKALTLSESLNLAHNFVVRSPTPSGQLEVMFPNSLSTNSTASFSQYSPSDAATWYSNNFAYLQSYLTNQASAQPNTISLRSILTTQNPVSEFAPSKYRDLTPVTPIPDVWVKPAPTGGIFLFGDSVSWKGHRFVCINPNGAAAGIQPVDPATPQPFYAWQMDNDTWIYQPWLTNPTKTAVNTANFGQLLLAYWSVMAEQKRSAVVQDWAPPFPITPEVATPNPLQPSPRMFRSPIRVLPTALPAAGAAQPWQLSPVQTMQLRAALAAVNTVDMRDADDDVTARTVHLTDYSPFTQPNPRMTDVIATVYGNERQPYITKVYATNAVTNPGPTQQDGYIAFELYNPDVRPLSLAGYAMGIITRPNTAPTATPQNFNPQLVPVLPTEVQWYGATAPVIPPGGYIVVASYDTPPADPMTGTILLPANVVKATGLPLLPGQIAMYVVQNLIPPQPTPPETPSAPRGALGAELMLFRPRHVDSLTGQGKPSHSVNTLAPLVAGPTPLRANAGQPTNQPYPAFHEGTIVGTVYTPNPADMVPVDAYDFTGLNTLPATANPTPTEWYYVRPNDPLNGKSWHFVYPGHYVVSPGAPPAAVPRLVDGTWSSDIPTLGAGLGTALTAAGVVASTVPFGTPTLTGKPGYRDIPLPMNSLDSAGPNIQRASSSGTAATAFPYGGFARNGDMLQVPFIGAYRLAIEDPVGSGTGTLAVLEMNPVTMDSALALGYSQGISFQEPSEIILQPAVPANPQLGLADPLFNSSLPPVPVENVGRFCPITPIDMNLITPTAPAVLPDDLFTAPSGVIPNQWLYHFSTRLFDYLTVQSPQQDYMPEVDPSFQDPDVDTLLGTSYGGFQKYSPPGAGVVVDVPNVTGGPVITKGVYNAQPFNPRNATEETASIQGLVNINTASWVVLASVPWVPPDYPNFNGTVSGTTRRDVNMDIGLSIAFYRDVNDGSGRGHGPFRSIFELANVPILPIVPGPTLPTNPLPLPPGTGPYFRFMLDTPGHNAPAVPYNQSQGNLSPAYANDFVLGSFKSQFMMMNRVSNLVTTRSDSFTAYILVQGWRDADTSSATLVVQRRAAFIIDRSKLLPGGAGLTTTNIPTN